MKLTLILYCKSGSVVRVEVPHVKLKPQDLDLDENQPAFAGYVIRSEPVAPAWARFDARPAV